MPFAWDVAIVARRALVLACGATVTGQQVWLADALQLHLQWLSKPSPPAPGGGKVHQHVALFVLATVLEDVTARNLAVHRLGEQLTLDYDEQGVHADGAVGYQLQYCMWWRDAMARLELEGITPPAAARRLELTPQFLAHATSPLGRFARIGDTDGGDPRSAEHPLTQFVTSGGEDGERPGTAAAVYDAGYAFVRSGWGDERQYRDEAFVTAIWGPQNRTHGHLDGGSVTFASEGVQWIDDTGRYSSGTESLRAYVSGREGHNVIALPGRSYRKNTEVALIGQADTDLYVDLTFHDSGYEGVSITRRVIFLKARRQLLVLDFVEAAHEVPVEQLWHCGRGVSARRVGAGFVLRHGDRSHYVSVLQGRCSADIQRGSTEPMAGWTSIGNRQAAAIDRLSVRTVGSQIFLATHVGSRIEGLHDLLAPCLSPQTLHLPVSQMVPAPLLHISRPSRHHYPADATGVGVTVHHEKAGLLTASVSGGGPFWAFYLFHVDGDVERSPYSRRSSRSFSLKHLHGSLLRVYSRDDTGAITTRTIPLTDYLQPHNEKTAS
ncbi:Heparinase II/III-like protein [Kocuria rosea]|nr:Heparinase II/III-like protein [Kocuria rosea]